MSFNGQFPQPPALPPRNPSARQAIPRRPVAAGPVPPPLPLASKPTVVGQTPPPPAAPRGNFIANDLDVISRCPENDTLYATAYWYSTPEAPKFEICSHCFASHVRSTQWAGNFQRQLRESDPNRHCRFSTLRMLQLWPQVLRNNDWAYITGYMNRRANIADCNGLTPVGPEVGTRWFHLKSRDIDNFGICAACYEDIALATPFGNNFEPSATGQPAGELWNCKMTEYARRAMEKYGQTNNWREVATSVGKVMQTPACNGAIGSVASKRQWYRPKPHIDGMVICDACYFHYFAASFMESSFEPARVDFMNGGWNTWVCDMSLLSTKVAFIRANQQKNYQIFWNASRTILASAPCPADSAYGGTWYGLGPTGEHAGTCAQCFAGIIEPFGFANHFVRVPSLSNEKRTCTFHEKSPRRSEYLKKYDNAISTRNLSNFRDFAIRFGPLPLCPTNAMVKNRRWYGRDEFLICESCWEEFAKETSLASQLPHRGIVLPDACCDMYSSRMRTLWNEACAKGDMTDFVTFAKHRAAVYAQTVPRMHEILAMTKMRMQQKQTLLMAGIMLQGADNIVGASRAPGYTTYGNSSIGYGFATQAGAQGAMQFGQGLNMSVVDGGEMMQVQQLEKMWKEVE
ncbi:hypothetical protein AOCH_002782 [Aspergillus ochraceoroseus]|uniref:Integral membrane protein n=1 Tax=Aspergillus ochraceoroseus TaxID=138278 RepID=A0A0F8UWZ3_9EURO|nr:hypothetical protein AOCH_002782 [Aspergillus ochraceoroseus]